MTTWRKLITESMRDVGESWDDVAQCTLSDVQLDRQFDCGFGGEEGAAFTLWTKERVYFPVCYDGSEWVDSVPRNPCGEATSHVGGG